jgi:hypothetical protein
MNTDSWTDLLKLQLPELNTDDPDPLGSLAKLTDSAHRTRNTDFLNRSYTFIRWAVRIDDDGLKRQIAWFFDLILQFEHSKTGCLDYLDWGDVKSLTDTFTVEPSFTDEEKFERLCREWKKRWSRNRKLPAPELTGGL